MKIFISKNQLISFSGIIVILAVWKLASVVSQSEQIVPSPEKTIETTLQILLSPGFWPDITLTLVRGLAGFVLSLGIALLLGVPAGLHPTFFHFINPFLVTIRSTPVVSVILLAIVWLGNESVPVFIAFLTMFPVICVNIVEGMKNVDRDLVSMARVYQIKKTSIVRDIYLPSIAPFLMGGISNALGFGWRAIIIGEVLSQPRLGIGTRMQSAQSYLLVGEVIAWTLIAIVISWLFEVMVRNIEKRVIKWKVS